MSDGSVRIAPDSTGQFIDTQVLTNGFGQPVNRQAICVASPTNISAIQDVVAGGVAPTSSLDAAVVVIRPDSTGSLATDFSVNSPLWPNIGSNFDGSSSLFPSWFLLQTVPANHSRLKITVDNMDPNDAVLCLFDDGTAASGGAPINATGFTLNPKVSAGPEGGHYESTTNRSRLQVFGASSSQFVAISTN